MKDYKLMIGLLFVATLGVNGLNLFLPKIIANAIDAYTHNTLNILHVCVVFGLVSLAVYAFTFLQGALQAYASERVARDLRGKAAAKISRQDYLFIERTNPSVILTNLTSDADAVKSFVSQAVPAILSSVILIIGASILLISINWKLALSVLAVLPIIAITFYLVFSKMGPLFKQSQEAIDWLNRVISESILGAALIRVLHSEKSELDKFIKANAEARSLGYKILALFASVIPVITFVSGLAIVIILALGGHFVILGTLSLGNFTAFMAYVAMLIMPIIMIGFVSNAIAQASASYGRMVSIFDAAEPKHIGTLNADINGDISVKHVSFTVQNKPVLKDVTFEVKAGQRIAIIGPTAAGKTQLLYLLIGLTHPTKGEVNYDGQSIQTYDPQSIHAQVGFVFQDSIMFNLTVRENIAFNESVTQEAFEKAVETAELKEFIDTLPQGFDTVVSERGTSLSGGQKQRIMLARALALDPKVLLLDDFTARVDTTTEARILKNLTKNYPDLTLVSVTQKIGSVENFDSIIVLMEGEVIAVGKHKELLETSPEYVQIFNSQKSTSAYELQT